MAELDVQVKVKKEAYELGKGLGAFVLAVRKAVADGWQIGQDLPAVMTAAMAHLPEAVQGIDQIGDEAKDKVDLAKSLIIGLEPMLEEFIEKKEA